MTEIAFASLPIYLWEPSARQWKRWLTARRKVSPRRPLGAHPALERNMRWPLRRATVDDVFRLVDEYAGDLALAAHTLESMRERHIRRRLPAVAHPSLLRYVPPRTPVDYTKAVRRLHLALRVMVASKDGLARLDWSAAQIPTAELLSAKKSYSLATPLDASLIRARTIEGQLEAVAGWLTAEYYYCLRRPVIVGPELIRPSKVMLLDDGPNAPTAPQVGITTGVYGLAIMWLLQALQDLPNVGVCKGCARPFQRLRGTKAFCDSACRSAYHRQRG